MKKIKVLPVFPLIVLLVSNLSGMELDNPWTADYVSRNSIDVSGNRSEPEHMIGKFPGKQLDPQDTFVSYIFTYGDIVLFSYADSNQAEVIDSAGTTVWSGIMMENEYACISDLSCGVYLITCSSDFSVISGDPFSAGLGCWYATNPLNKPIASKLLTVGPMGTTMGLNNQPCMVVFAYQDNTHVLMERLDEEEIVWEGDLDSAEYYLWNLSYSDGTPVVSVNASKPVSVMTGGGVVGIYAPAFNGTFTGTDFMTYQHYWDLSQDIEIIPWHDNTMVTVTNLDDPSDTIWSVFCAKRGEIKGTAINSNGSGPQALYIHADKDISVSQSPWASYGTVTIAFYMIRGMDPTGTGLGTEFFLPIETSFADYPSRMHVIAFQDNSQVEVTRIPRDGGAETAIWQGTLNTGEYYRYTCPYDPSAHAIYHVVSSEIVATVGSCHDRQGSDFYPVVPIFTQGINDQPISRISELEILNSVGREIGIRYYNFPRGLHTRVFDASGRKVDEIHHDGTSGTVTWGQGHGQGIYFIVSETVSHIQSQKVVLIK